MKEKTACEKIAEIQPYSSDPVFILGYEAAKTDAMCVITDNKISIGEKVMTQFAWVIEGDSIYWNGRSLERDGFSPNHEDAIRFSRKQDAEVIKNRLFRELTQIGLRVIEHGWCEK